MWIRMGGGKKSIAAFISGSATGDHSTGGGTITKSLTITIPEEGSYILTVCGTANNGNGYNNYTYPPTNTNVNALTVEPTSGISVNKVFDNANAQSQGVLRTYTAIVDATTAGTITATCVAWSHYPIGGAISYSLVKV